MTLNCIWILKINLLFSSCTRHNTLNRDATVNRLYHILFLLFSTQNETQKHPLKSLCIWFQDFHSSLDENIFVCYIGYYSYYNEIILLLIIHHLTYPVAAAKALWDVVIFAVVAASLNYVHVQIRDHTFCY